MKVERIIIHHSASPRGTTVDDIRGWHQNRGFNDIGYHYVIEEDGSVQPGRRPDVMGAHAKGANRDSLGICITGDNTKLFSEWNSAQTLALRELLNALRLVFGDDIHVEGHRDAGTTQTKCPGISLDAVLR